MKNIQTISKMTLQQVLYTSNSCCQHCSIATSLPIYCPKVLEVLEVVGLSKYKDTFQKECISGDILCLLTQEVLQEELHMHSDDCNLLLNLVAGNINVST